MALANKNEGTLSSLQSKETDPCSGHGLYRPEAWVVSIIAPSFFV